METIPNSAASEIIKLMLAKKSEREEEKRGGCILELVLPAVVWNEIGPQISNKLFAFLPEQ